MSSSSVILEKCIENSERVSWKISEILPDSFQISFDKKFLPASVTKEDELTFLDILDKRNLNFIWGASYFNLFAFVEEYITIFSLSIANDSSFRDTNQLRAFVRFSEEEIKHQQLFRKFIGKFLEKFGSPCEFIGNERDVASVILSHSKLSVLILTYHLELVTQQHYLECVRADDEIDEKFQDILKKHWLEEVQHAKLDLVKIKELADDLEPKEIESSFEEYFYILEALGDILLEQVKMNFRSLVNSSKAKEKFSNKKAEQSFTSIQHQAFFDFFVLKGMRNNTFIEDMGKIFEGAPRLLERKAVSMGEILKLSQRSP